MLHQFWGEMGSRSQDDSDAEAPKKEPNQNSSSEDESDSQITEEMLSNGFSLSPLESWSFSDLKEASESPELLDALITASPFVIALENKKSQILKENARLAKENLYCEEAIERLMLDLKQKQSSLKLLYEEVEASSASYAQLAEAYSPPNIRDSLQKSVSKVDEESEKTAESFLNGGMDVEDFISEYTSKRILSHIRKVKCEKLGNQLKKFQQAGL